MKTILLGLSITCVSLNVLSQNFEPSAPITVASGYGNYHPQMEILGDGQLGMIWTDLATQNLYFSKSTAPGIFTTPIQLNPPGHLVQTYNWSGPDLYASGSDVYVAFHDLGYETGHVYLVKSTDYGLTFGDTVRVDNFVDSYPQFPDVVVHNDTVYVAYMKNGFSVMDPQQVLSRSVDGGLTFETYVGASSWVGEEACDCCQPDLIVDDQRVIIFYRQNASNTREVKGVVSYDRGVTFTEFISVDEYNWTIAACPSTGPDARFLDNGNAVCAYRTSIGGVSKIFVAEYDWTTGTVINEADIYTDGIANTGISFPQIFVDGSIIGIVWEGLGSGTDVFFNASSTGVTNLSPQNAINVTNITGSQSKPDIVVENGNYHIVYSELTGAEVRYVTINDLTSVDESASSAVSYYPNPVASELTVDLTKTTISSGTISLLDVTGRIVYSTEFSDELVVIPTTDLISGMYFIQVVGADKKIEFSFIKA